MVSDGHHATVHHALTLAQKVIENSVERTDREKTVPKRLPEATLCRLLGLSGLTWDEQDMLAPIWLTLHQQPDKVSKTNALRGFFQDLGEELPAFEQFENALLFEHIINHKFTPGSAHKNSHHGVSLLAVSMRSFAAQEQELEEEYGFDNATNKTPEAIIKHSAKGPPPLPTTVSDLLLLMWRMIVLTTGLFTTNCSLAIQLKDMHRILQKKEQRILSKPDVEADLIPQLVWAITSSAREFYITISKRVDVDPPDDGEPNLPVAELSIYTSMLKARLKLDIDDMPDQWRRQPKPKGDTNRAGNRGGDSTRNNGSGQDRRHGTNPFRTDNQRTGGSPFVPNPKIPQAFLCDDMKTLRTKFSRVTLTGIVKEAGLTGRPSKLDIKNWAPTTCLNWVCMGRCRKEQCQNQHPTDVDEATASHVYKQLEPGIKKIIAGN
jgi:hypothetical protein